MLFALVAAVWEFATFTRTGLSTLAVAALTALSLAPTLI